MARNGSGVYSLPSGSIVADGQTVEAAQHNTPLNDIATDLNTARPISSGGTGSTTAGAARTALGLGSIATQAASAVAITGGTADGVVIGDTTPAAGNFTDLVGGATTLTSINFGASTLDQYVEGTFTPVVSDASSGGNTATTTLAVGRYVRVGRLVTVRLAIEGINTAGMTGGNTLYIQGLPFAGRNAQACRAASPARLTGFTFTNQPYLFLGVANNYLRVSENISGGSAMDITVSNAGTSIYGDIAYEV